MDNNPLYKQFSLISEYCERLEEANYDSYKLFPPVAEEEIQRWESDNEAVLPSGLKNWYLLSNGFDMGSAVTILSLSMLKKSSLVGTNGHDEGFIAGHYIGDGSMLIADSRGGFYILDHAYNELRGIAFEKFLHENVLERLEECMRDEGLM